MSDFTALKDKKPSSAHPTPELEKIIGSAASYAELLNVFRVRMQQLNLSHETVDAISGLADRYSARLIGRSPSKLLGPTSFDALLGSLAVRLVVVVDPVALARIRSRLVPRKYHRPRRRQPQLELPLRW